MAAATPSVHERMKPDLDAAAAALLAAKATCNAEVEELKIKRDKLRKSVTNLTARIDNLAAAGVALETMHSSATSLASKNNQKRKRVQSDTGSSDCSDDDESDEEFMARKQAQSQFLQQQNAKRMERRQIAEKISAARKNAAANDKVSMHRKADPPFGM